MFTKVCLFLLLALLVAASAANLREGSSKSQELGQDLVDVGELKEFTDASERLRQLATTPCTKGGGAVVFNSKVTITPGLMAKTCSAASLASIGQIINATLVTAGNLYMPGSIFVAGVCEVPSTTSKRARRLAATGYVWKGGGVCKGCNADNGDGRRVQVVGDTLVAAQNLFQQTFDVQSLLIETYVATSLSVALLGYPCFGLLPKVAVDIQVVALPSLDVPCLSPALRNLFTLLLV